MDSPAGAPSMPVRDTLGALWRAARPAQWQKNLLLLAAAVFSAGEHWDVQDAEDWRRVLVRGALGVLLFSCASSAVYLANDARDAEADRAHPRKQSRPVASGALRARTAMQASVALGAAAILGGAALGGSFVAVLVAYLGLSAGYILAWRAVPVLEAIVISAGFGLRAAAGAAAIEVPASWWLIALATAGALFVVWLKREQERSVLGDMARAHRKALVAYPPGFLDLAAGLTGWWIGGLFAAYAVRPGAPGGGLLLLALVPVVLGLWRFATVARRPGARPVDELVARDAPLLAAVAAFILVSFVVLAFGR